MTALVTLAAVMLALVGPRAPAAAQGLVRGDVRPLAETTVQLVVETPQPLGQRHDGGPGPFYRLSGWATDVQAATGTGIRQLVAYLDGPSGQGHLLGWARHGLPRPDVATALNSPGATGSGFELVWRAADMPLQTEPVRQYVLYVYADIGEAWALARVPVAIATWADSGDAR